MPKLKSALSGLAISTALTGGLVATGAAAGATTQVNTGTSATTSSGWLADHFDHRRRHRCGKRHHGWGWGGWGNHHRRGGGRICIIVRNDNFNDNDVRDND